MDTRYVLKLSKSGVVPQGDDQTLLRLRNLSSQSVDAHLIAESDADW